MRQHEHDAEYVLDHRVGAVRADVGNGDAVLMGVVEADVVGAGRREADEPQLARLLEYGRCHPELIRKHELRVTDPLGDLVIIGLVVDDEVGEESLQRTQVEPRAHRRIVEKYGFHCDLRQSLSQRERT